MRHRSAVGVVAHHDVGGQDIGDQVEDRLLGWWPAGPCRSRSPGRAPRRRPCGAGWRASGPGRRRGAGSPRRGGPGRGSRAGRHRGPLGAGGGGRRRGARARCCARRAAGPWPPPSRPPPRPRVRSKGTTTSSKKTSENSSLPCMVRIGRTAIPGSSMSTKRAVIPRWADSGGPGPGEEDAALCVLGQAGPDLLTGDLPTAVGAHRPAGQGGQVAPRPGLGEPLAPRLVPPEEGGDHGRGQLGRGVVDHGRGEDLGHRVEPGLARGPGRSAPRPGRRAAGSSRRAPRPARASRSASSRHRRRAA